MSHESEDEEKRLSAELAAYDEAARKEKERWLRIFGLLLDRMSDEVGGAPSDAGWGLMLVMDPKDHFTDVVICDNLFAWHGSISPEVEGTSAEDIEESSHLRPGLGGLCDGLVQLVDRMKSG